MSQSTRSAFRPLSTMKKMKLTSKLIVGAVVIIAAPIYFLLPIKKPVKTVAIIAAHSLLVHRQLYDGFAECIARSAHAGRCTLHPYLVDIEDHLKIAAVCESALDRQPDVIVVFGHVCNQIMHGLMLKRKSRIKAVFVGVDMAVELGLVDSFDRPGGNYTGVIMHSTPQASTDAQILLLAKPSVKKVLIPFNVTSDFNGSVGAAARAVKSYVESHGVVVDVVPIDGLGTALQTIETLLQGHDVLLLLERDLLIQLSAGIAKLCQEAGVTFFCETSDGIAAGAALTYATNTSYLGIEAARIATQILFEGGEPATMPVVTLKNTRDLFINTGTALAQGYVPNLPQIMHDLRRHKELSWLAPRVKVIE